ncbi:MAG: hypothetical protein AAGE05_09650, partial [Pseudomonadota bacterium]
PPPPPPAAEAEQTGAPASEQAEPARDWVQLATGPTQDGMRFTYRRYARANTVFAGREAWYTPLGQTNRLLVGPFDSGAAAQTFIDTLTEAGIEALRWRSPDGQPVTRLYRTGASPQPTEAAMAGGAESDTLQTEATPSHPARNWAQIAIGRERSALRFTYRQFSRRAPDAFDGQTGWFAPWNATNRLLVGPFDTRAAAQVFLDAISEEGEIEGHTFRSAEGQEVMRLDPQ